MYSSFTHYADIIVTYMDTVDRQGELIQQT